MKKTMVWCTTSAVILTLALSGCAGLGKGPSDEELIKGTIDTFKTGLMAQDLEKMLSVVSDNFTNAQAADKAALRDLFDQAVNAGFFEGAEVNTDNAETKIDGTTATVYPIDLSGAPGSVSIELLLAKEGSNWLITGLNIDGM